MIQSKLAQRALLVCALIPFAGPADAKAKFATFDPVGSTYTYVAGVNAAGTVAGFYDDGNAVAHGFIRTPDGSITMFDVPGATETEVLGIDDEGAVTGWFQNGGSQDCFERDADGTITTFAPSEVINFARSINAKGAVTGDYRASSDVAHGFVRAPDGAITSFDPPGVQSAFMVAASINAKGAIAGSYVKNNAAMHGFIRSPGGAVKSFVAPNGTKGTFAESVNAWGWIAGYGVDSAGVDHGFVRAPDGSATVFDPPGSSSTQAFGINDKGFVAGHYFSAGAYHGFVRAADGTITSFDVPGNVTATFVQGLNAGGAVAGSYRDSQNVVHGFLRSP